MLSQPFFQVSLPLMATILIAAWVNSKSMDGVHKRLDDLNARVGDLASRMELPGEDHHTQA
jgi:hypothetical protein